MRERVEREDILLPEAARPARSLDPCNMIEREEELQLVHAVLSIGMARWCAEDSLMKDLTGKAVLVKLKWGRLIYSNTKI